MKKITLVNQVTGPLFIDIANAFSKDGFKTTLHTGLIEETYASLEKEVNVKKSQKYNRKSSLARMVTWGMFFIKVFFKLLFDHKKTTLFLVSNPPFAPFLGLIFYKLFNRPYYILVYDIYPDALVEFNYVSKDSWIVKFWSKLNNQLFEKAEKVFTISKGMEERISKYYSGDNIQVVYSWVDPDFIKPIAKEKNWFVKEHNLADKTTVLYSGNLGITHDIESIVEAAKELQKNPKIFFLIIGSGAKEKKIRGLIQDYQLQNIKLLPFQPSSTVPYSMTSGDIAIVTLAKGAGSLSVPSKTYYMMSAGLSVIAMAEQASEIADLVHAKEIGNVVPPDEPTQLAKIILSMVNDENQLLNYKKKCSFRFEIIYSTECKHFCKPDKK